MCYVNHYNNFIFLFLENFYLIILFSKSKRSNKSFFKIQNKIIIPFLNYFTFIEKYLIYKIK